MRRTVAKRNSAAAVYEFLDSAFLHNKRPAIPGGAWPLDALRNKSVGDLQQVWFQLIKERNMLLSTREHYLRHQEELGAMPAPSRLKMVKESMQNIRQVMQERDNEANDKAIAIFRERLEKGIYRYPPGPQPPPGTGNTTSIVVLSLQRKISEARIRELFGRYDVYEPHKGIVTVSMALSPEALAAKEAAEAAWEAYQTATRDYEEYQAIAAVTSRYDYTQVELAPGVFEPILPRAAKSDAAPAGEEDGVSACEGDAVVASQCHVPAPKEQENSPTNTVERLLYESRPAVQKSTIQLGYFPNITREAPKAPPQRPVHPDEIGGPWTVRITYDSRDGLEYVASLGIASVDGVAVLSVAEDDAPRHEQYAARCPIYQEALRAERAAEETTHSWPHVPQWRNDYKVWTTKRISDVVAYNYSNVVDYVDREVLLTGKSVWECPIDIDYTCGTAINVPVHAKEPPSTFRIAQKR